MKRVLWQVLLLSLACGRTPPRSSDDHAVVMGSGWAIEGGLENNDLPSARERFTIGMRFRIDSDVRTTFFSKGRRLLVETQRNGGAFQLRATIAGLSCETGFNPFLTQVATSLVLAVDLRERVCRIYLDGADMTAKISGTWPDVLPDDGAWTIGGDDGFPGVVDDVFVDLDAVWSSRNVWLWHADRGTGPMPNGVEPDSWCRGGDGAREGHRCDDASGNGSSWKMIGSARWVADVHHAKTIVPPMPRGLNRQDFVFLGQSNCSGRGNIEELTDGEFVHRDRMFLYANDGRVVSPPSEPWDDPRGQDSTYPVSKDSSVGVGPALAFADRLLDRWRSRTIGLLPCARGGSKVAGGGADSWMVAHERADRLFGECVRRIREQTDGELAALVVYQGEAEAGEAYAAENIHFRWAAVINAFRDALAQPALTVLFVVPPAVAPAGESFLHWGTMRSSLSSVCDLLAHCKTVDAPNGPWIERQNLHLATRAQLELGRSLADAMLETEYSRALPN